ncbi:3-hydroxyisobutyryl-CoA hydrolase-like protein 2, mitochondrial, partial [Tanacetum coccineum]
VLVEGRAFSRAAILNRPSQLNAITTSMAGRLQRLYESWEDNSQIGFVTMKGSGRAFSSGADMVTIYRLLQEDKDAECKEFFRTLYQFIYLLTFLDGITMGGGAGIAVPGMFRIATDKTVFATPEVQMGFHPDSGASFYLSRLPGYLGEFLALTGEKLNGAELVPCGLATHYSLNAVCTLSTPEWVTLGCIQSLVGQMGQVYIRILTVPLILALLSDEIQNI